MSLLKLQTSNGTQLVKFNPWGKFTIENLVNIIPINKIVVVDKNGYIGFDLTPYFQFRGSTFYYNYAIMSSGDNFSDAGLGQVVFYTPAGNSIGGREYRTVIIGGKEWLAENLDFKFSGLAINQGKISSSEPRAYYYNYNESTYGWNGNKCGLLYNGVALRYIIENASTLIPGWHVPTRNEWNALITAVGTNPGTKLKSTTLWDTGYEGTDDYGFSILPTGYVYRGYDDATDFGYFGKEGSFWTADVYGSYNQYYKYARYNSNRIDESYQSLYYGYPIRLVKDVQP